MSEAERIAAFEKELCHLINRHSMEGGSNTPDFILAAHLVQCLIALNRTARRRDEWYGKAESEINVTGDQP